VKWLCQLCAKAAAVQVRDLTRFDTQVTLLPPKPTPQSTVLYVVAHREHFSLLPSTMHYLQVKYVSWPLQYKR